MALILASGRDKDQDWHGAKGCLPGRVKAAET